jgi:leucyl aminopeptidase
MAEARMTAVRTVRGGPSTARADLLLLPVVERGLKDGLGGFDRRLLSALTRRAAAADFRGRADEQLVYQSGDATIALLGLGPSAGDLDVWRRFAARGRRAAERQGARRVVAHLGEQAARAEVVAAVAEGFHLVGYRFERYRRESSSKRVDTLTLVGEQMPPPGALRRMLAEAEVVASCVFEARDVVNEPPSVATPRYLAEHAARLAAASPGMTVEVWEPERITREGLAGLLAVARGSQEEPRFIVTRYAGKGARRRVALVGKGITFDSGGLSLKPPKGMEQMKYDMAGAAAVLSAVAAAARLGLAVDVTGYVPATENLPSGTAQKPGDVIRFLNGKTAEVLNTDAEGRLILADGLALASRAKPDAVIDLATLTGAARVAVGGLYACVLGSDQGLVDALLAAGRAAGEPVWQLPLVREYREELKSTVADVRNVGTSGDAGTILGALFLEEFVDGVPWAHLDIAGPAFTDKDLPHAPRGATGYGVRLLVAYLRRLAA